MNTTQMNMNNSSILFPLPECERPKNKAAKEGVRSLSNMELLMCVLEERNTCFPELAQANNILGSDAGGLQSLGRYRVEELSSIYGMDSEQAVKVAAAVELGRRVVIREGMEKRSVESPAETAEVLASYLRDRDVEVLAALMLNIKNEILSFEEITIGSISSSIFNPRDVLRRALMKNASALILAHNHPSGNPNPSSSDIEASKRMAEAGRIMGIPLLDHIIIGDGKYISLREENLL